MGLVGPSPVAPGPRPRSESCGTPLVRSAIEVGVPDGEELGLGFVPPVHAVAHRARAPARNSRRVGMAHKASEGPPKTRGAQNLGVSVYSPNTRRRASTI